MPITLTIRQHEQTLNQNPLIQKVSVITITLDNRTTNLNVFSLICQCHDESTINNFKINHSKVENARS